MQRSLLKLLSLNWLFSIYILVYTVRYVMIDVVIFFEITTGLLHPTCLVPLPRPLPSLLSRPHRPESMVSAVFR